MCDALLALSNACMHSPEAKRVAEQHQMSSLLLSIVHREEAVMVG
jgi:hypothetical protein